MSRLLAGLVTLAVAIGVTVPVSAAVLWNARDAVMTNIFSEIRTAAPVLIFHEVGTT
jgi:hypothetical protein